MEEDLNLSGSDINMEIVPCITRARANQACHEEFSLETQAALNAMEIADVDAQSERFEIHDNVTQRRHWQIRLCTDPG